MKVIATEEGNKLSLVFKPHAEDTTQNLTTASGYPFGMRRESCHFIMPDGWTLESMHPDMLALAALLIIEPFVNEKLVMPFGVSKSFKDLIKTSLNKTVSPVDPDLDARTALDSAVPGLAYSGGVDSTVAALLMPKATKLIFVHRDESGIDKPGLYKSDAALFACAEIRKLGHQITEVMTDFEFIREPVGFTNHLSSSVPIVLLADYFNISSVAFGMILESAYAIGDLAFSKPKSIWQKIFTGAGLPVSLPTGGLSEVATSKIILTRQPYRSIAQSCVRGAVQKPCQRCVKCFRMALLETKLSSGNLDLIDVESFFKRKEVINHFNHIPLHHEDVYAFALSGYNGKNKILELLAKKVRAERVRTSWLSKWFPDSASLIYEGYRREVTNNIQKYLEAMDSQDVEQLKQWFPKGLLSYKLRSVSYKYQHSRFVSYINKKATNK